MSDRSPIIGSTDEEWARVEALGWKVREVKRFEKRHDEDGFSAAAERYDPPTKCQCCQRVTDSGHRYEYAEGGSPAQALAALVKQIENMTRLRAALHE